jgi:Zn finger protein HypA/HybF involved in hydrogenase expression
MYIVGKIYVAKMKCPHCEEVFKLTQEQLVNNKFFTCPNCQKVSYGSTKIDNTGVILGVKSERSFEKIYQKV